MLLRSSSLVSVYVPKLVSKVAFVKAMMVVGLEQCINGNAFGWLGGLAEVRAAVLHHYSHKPHDAPNWNDWLVDSRTESRAEMASDLRTRMLFVFAMPDTFLVLHNILLAARTLLYKDIEQEMIDEIEWLLRLEPLVWWDTVHGSLNCLRWSRIDYRLGENICMVIVNNNSMTNDVGHSTCIIVIIQALVMAIAPELSNSLC